jgi:hypothetical protein
LPAPASAPAPYAGRRASAGGPPGGPRSPAGGASAGSPPARAKPGGGPQ